MSLDIVNILNRLSKIDMNNSINHIVKSMDSSITNNDISNICNIMKSNMGMINDAIESKNNLNFNSLGFMQYIKQLDCNNQSGGSNKKSTKFKNYHYYIIIAICVILIGLISMIFKKETHNAEESNILADAQVLHDSSDYVMGMSYDDYAHDSVSIYVGGIYVGGGKTNLNTNKITTIIVVIITKFFAQ